MYDHRDYQSELSVERQVALLRKTQRRDRAFNTFCYGIIIVAIIVSLGIWILL